MEIQDSSNTITHPNWMQAYHFNKVARVGVQDACASKKLNKSLKK